MLAIVPRTTDAHALVTREQIGFSVRPYDVSQQVTIIRQCAAGEHDLEAMGNRARRLVESDFDFGTSRGAFEEVLLTTRITPLRWLPIMLCRKQFAPRWYATRSFISLSNGLIYAAK